MTTNPASTITTEIHTIEGEYMLDAQAMALLFGVGIEAVQALPMTAGALHLPREWERRGRRRVSEAQAHTGSDFILDILQFWAQRDHGADLNVVYR